MENPACEQEIAAKATGGALQTGAGMTCRTSLCFCGVECPVVRFNNARAGALEKCSLGDLEGALVDVTVRRGPALRWTVMAIACGLSLASGPVRGSA
eukprot:scaffold353962_cov49-Prasinocladus_malaysianus.AAC.1